MNLIFRLWGGRSRKKRAARAVTPEPGESQAGWRVASDVSTSLHEGGMVVFHERAGHIFTCNAIGAEIWQMLANGSSAKHLGSLAQRRGRPLDEFMREALRFIDRLKVHGLIVPGDKP
jgi:hypothetical protein